MVAMPRPRHRSIRALLVITLASTIVSVAPFSPAGAGQPYCAGSNASNAPDGRIKVETEPFNGIGTWPEAAAGAVANEGEQATFKLRWKNLTDVNRTIRVNRHDWNPTGPGFSFVFFLNGQNVSRFLHEGALVFQNIAPGNLTPTIELVVKNKTVDFGEIHRFVRGRYSGSQPNHCDMLHIAVAATNTP